MDNLHIRKHNRLKNYDYSQNGIYFITVCTKNHHNLFGEIIPAVVGANCVRPQLNEIGQIVKDEIAILSSTYENISIDKYVVMPNHVHMILVVMDDGRIKTHCGQIQSGRTQFAPTTVSRAIKQWKGIITKKIGFSPWQKSFHDHIICNEKDYCRIAEYIENNPTRWIDDCYYKK